MEFHHVSVMLEETVHGLLTSRSGIYVDCTLGGAGHAYRLARELKPKARIIGIDQDADAVEAARKRLAGASCRVDIVHDNFSRLDSILEAQGASVVDGILFDLGVSSHQIDEAERGFSYMQDAPLDMRMDSSRTVSAADIVNTWDAAELERIFRAYGEERWARRIAEFIEEARAEHPIETTGELVDIICRAVPKAVRRAAGGHPAKRVFQAVRIAVNDELSILEKTFRSAVHHLKPGGRIAIITFHSLEDRIAKRTLQEMARGCICPPELPVCMCDHEPEIRSVGKVIRPSRKEADENPRSRSAKLRIAEKIETKNGRSKTAEGRGK